MANNLRIGIAVAFMLALVLPIPTSAEDVDPDLVLREVGERMDHLREWVNDRLADFEPREEEEPWPLGKTVSLSFTLEGTDRSATILTAMSAYMISSAGTSSRGQAEEGHEVSETAFSATGRILMDEARDGLLVTCTGAFRVIRNAEREGSEEGFQTSVSFHTSAMFRPGETHVIASQDGLKLVLAVNIVPED